METAVEYQKDEVDCYTPEQIEKLRAMIQEGRDARDHGEIYTLEEVCRSFGIDPGTL